MISAGTRLTYTATYGGFYRKDPDDLVATLRGPLETNWGLVIEDVQVDSGLLGTGLFQKNEITLRVQALSAYGEAAHIRSIIDHEIIEAGETVSASRITSIRPPGQRQDQSTGSTPPPDGGGDDSGWFPDFDFSTVAILAAVFLLTIVLVGIFLSPGTPAQVARSFARR